MNVPVTVCMPKTAPKVKIDKCKDYGANVVIYGDSFDQAKEYTLNLAKEKNLTYVNG